MAELEAMLEPLRAEYEQLKGLAATFDRAGRARTRPDPTSRRRPGRPRSTPPASGGGRGGTRAAQAVALITARPGLTAADLAEAIGISRNYLYRVLPTLEEQGIVVKRGTGYHPAG
jgi:CRP-like cAMP-binding protein